MQINSSRIVVFSGIVLGARTYLILMLGCLNHCHHISSGVPGRVFMFLGVCSISMDAFLVFLSVHVCLQVSVNIYSSFSNFISHWRVVHSQCLEENHRKKRDSDKGNSRRHDNEWRTRELTYCIILDPGLRVSPVSPQHQQTLTQVSKIDV